MCRRLHGDEATSRGVNGEIITHLSYLCDFKVLRYSFSLRFSTPKHTSAPLLDVLSTFFPSLHLLSCTLGNQWNTHMFLHFHKISLPSEN